MYEKIKMSVEELEQKGLEQKEQKEPQKSPFELFFSAVIRNNLDTVKQLVSEGVDPTQGENWALIEVCRLGYLDILKFLVSVGVDVNTRDGWALHWSSSYGHLDIVKYLVSVGADITVHDSMALSKASTHGHLHVAEYLLSVGANPNRLTPSMQIYFKMKRAYTKWRKLYLRRWVRRVLTPLYFSPNFSGGIQTKKALAKDLAILVQ